MDTVDESKSSADRRADYSEVLAGDPFPAAARSRWPSGAVAALETDDDVALCEGCTL
jgi:hypothetical protein